MVVYLFLKTLCQLESYLMPLFFPCRTFEFFLHADENFFMLKVWKILNEILKNIKDMNYNENIKTIYIGLPFLIEAIFKACFRYFLSSFYFSSNDSPSKTTKNLFFFHLKSSFRS